MLGLGGRRGRLAVVGLLARQLVTSRRCLSGWVVYAAALATAYTLSAGPPLQAYQFTAALLLPVAVWLTSSAAVLDVSTAALFAAAVGGPGRLYVLTVASGAVAGLPLVVAAVGYGAVADPAPDPLATLAAGALAHCVSWLAGTAVGAVTSRPVLGGPARSLLAGVAAAVLLLAFPAASPAGRALVTLAADGTGTGARLAGLAATLLVTALLAVALVLAAAAAVGRTRALTRPADQ